MPSEDDLLAGAGLPVWFAGDVGALVGVIRSAASPSGSGGTAPGNARSYLRTIRGRAAPDTHGLDAALDAVVRAVDQLEGVAGDLHGAAVAQAGARSAAVAVLGELAEVLRSAEPSERARALFG